MAGTLQIQLLAPHTYQRRFGTSDIDALLESSHHYMISRGPQVKIVNTSVRGGLVTIGLATSSTFLGRFCLEVPGAKELSVSTLGGDRYWIIRGPNGEAIAHGSAWAAAAMGTADGTAGGSVISMQEVLYIGKAYGRTIHDGGTTRNSRLRLAGHETLMRIYEDYQGTDDDVFVTPLLTGDGMWTNDDYIFDDDLGPVLDRIGNVSGISGEATRVALVEEGLIEVPQRKWTRGYAIFLSFLAKASS